MLTNQTVKQGDAVRGSIVFLSTDNEEHARAAAAAREMEMDARMRVSFNPPLTTKFGYVLHSALISEDALKAFSKRKNRDPLQDEVIEGDIHIMGNKTHPQIWLTNLRDPRPEAFAA